MELSLKGALLKRKDFLDKDEEAKAHPNRTFYYRSPHRTQKDVDRVICACTRKLALEPDAQARVKALFTRGTAHAKRGDWGAAIRDFNAVLQQPELPAHAIVAALYQRGRALSEAGDEHGAIADCTRVLQLDPDHVSAAYTRAACQNRVGQLDEAVRDYAFALERDSARAGSATEHGRTGKPAAVVRGQGRAGAEAPATSAEVVQGVTEYAAAPAA
eukprot:g8190.t1